jgi:ABC-type sugar transport system ATPase subunit
MVTEQLGDEQLLAVRIGPGDFRVAGVDPELELKSGEPVELAIGIENLHFFDPQSGVVLR